MVEKRLTWVLLKTTVYLTDLSILSSHNKKLVTNRDFIEDIIGSLYSSNG